VNKIGVSVGERDVCILRTRSHQSYSSFYIDVFVKFLIHVFHIYTPSPMLVSQDTYTVTLVPLSVRNVQ